jgi:hypothetical protein
MSTENQLIEIVKKSDVEEATAKNIIESFKPFYDDAIAIVEDAKSIIVTSEEQKDEIEKAHGYRMKLRTIRTSADKKRKELKEDSLKYGKAVQGVYNFIEESVSGVESYLQEQEDFVTIQEEKKISATRAIRTNGINPFITFVPEGIDFGTMSDEGFNRLLSGAKVLYQKDIDEKLELARKANEENLLKEKQNTDDKTRKAELAQYNDVYSVLPFLGSMPEPDYIIFRDDLKTKHNDKIIEADRIAKEKALGAERKKSLEQYKDVIPAIVNFGAMTAEQFEIAKADILANYNRKMEADKIIKADEEKKRADEAARLEAEEESKKANSASDKEKLRSFVTGLVAYYHATAPSVESDKAKEILHGLANHMMSIQKRIIDLSETL